MNIQYEEASFSPRAQGFGQRTKLFFVSWTGFIAMMMVFHGIQLISSLQNHQIQAQFGICTAADSAAVRQHVETLLGEGKTAIISVAEGRPSGTCPQGLVYDAGFEALLERSESRRIFSELTDDAKGMHSQGLRYTTFFPEDGSANQALAAIIAAGFAYILWAILDRRGRVGAVPSWQISRRWVVQGVVCFLVAFAACSVVGWTLGAFGLIEQREPPIRGITLSVALIALVAAPVTEEVIFRYWLLQRMSLAIGPIAALLLSSAVFSLAHLEFEPFILVSRFITGFCLGVLWLRTASLWSCVLAHGLFNAAVIGLAQLAFTLGDTAA